MTIRQLTRGDREEYLKMSSEFYASPAVLSDVPPSYRENAFEEFLRGTHARCFMFEEQSLPVGYGIITFLYMQEAGGMCVFFDEIYVREGFRSRGYGRQFFDHVFKNFPAPRYLLEVEPENVRAVARYKRLGFDRRGYELMEAVRGGE